MFNRVIAITAFLFSASTVAGPVTITNTFSADTTARAAEVNQNFTDVKTAVDDNDDRINVNAGNISNNTAAINAISGSGTKVMSGVNEIGLLWQHYPSEITALNSNGYVVTLLFSGGIIRSEYLEITPVLYVGTNCTGDKYIQTTAFIRYSVSDSYLAVYGEVFNSGTPGGDIVYIPKNPTVIPAGVATQSSSIGGVCTSPNNQTLPNVIQIFANNEGVTGVPDVGYSGPITIGQ